MIIPQVGVTVHYVGPTGDHQAAIMVKVIDPVAGTILLREFSNDEIELCTYSAWSADPAAINTWHEIH